MALYKWTLTPPVPLRNFPLSMRNSRCSNGDGLPRCRKSCRLRWINYPRPSVNFSGDEEDLIIRLYALLGNRWSLIAGRLPGRTGDEVQKYWTSHLRRKLAMGINRSNLRRRLQMVEQRCGPEDSNSGVDTDRVSDAASSVEASSYVLPDLNLELTPEPEDNIAVNDKNSSVLTLPLFV